MPSAYRFGALLLLSSTLGVDGVKRAPKPRGPPPPSQPSAPPSAASAAQAGCANGVVTTISVTITPFHTTDGIEIDDNDRLQTCAQLLQDIRTEMQMRMADGQVRCFLLSRERGETDKNPHINGHYDVVFPRGTDVRASMCAERKWLREILDEARGDSHVRVKLTMRKVNAKNRSYAYGYDLKVSGSCTEYSALANARYPPQDEGLDHFMKVSLGFTDEELRDFQAHYRSKASECELASKKMNKNPNTGESLTLFKVGSLFTLCAWFVSQHKLSRLAKYLTIPIIVAWALETKKYGLDDSLLVGKHGGGILDRKRAQAFFQLASSNVSKPHLTIPLIETVLFGNTEPTSTEFDTECHDASLPTTSELASWWNLQRAKDFCRDLEDTLEGSRRTGEFIVIDFLGTVQAHDAMSHMTNAGLAGRGILRYDQLPNACGYNSAAWSCMLRELGPNFHSLSEDNALAVNNPEMIKAINFKLGKGPTAVADWLSDDDILQAVTFDNPDGEMQSPHWLSGPAPMNFWRIYFDRTVLNSEDWNRVHIMVVNTENQYTLTATPTGLHWLVIAWRINEDEDVA